MLYCLLRENETVMYNNEPGFKYLTALFQR
jgi:hypothetical protein